MFYGQQESQICWFDVKVSQISLARTSLDYNQQHVSLYAKKRKRVCIQSSSQAAMLCMCILGWHTYRTAAAAASQPR